MIASPLVLEPTRASSSLAPLFFLAIFTLVLHLPFLPQPPKGDEVNYMDMAAHIFDHPFTPLNFTYVFQGRPVDMAGHPHPPLNAYLLALVWGVWGRYSPVPFHATYLIFSLGISFAAYFLAAHFTARPLWAALLVASAPVVQVAGNSLETDAPQLALLLAGAAFFLARRFVWAGLFLALAGFTALQALPVAPLLLLVYFLRGERPPRAAWFAAAAPFFLLISWQALQFSITHRLPAAMLFNYATGPTFGRLSLKGLNALGLLQHLGVMLVLVLHKPKLSVFIPAACSGAVVAALVSGYPWWERVLLLLFVTQGLQTIVWLWDMRRNEPFLAAWCLAYFTFTLLVFFAGTAGYLIPLAAPLIFLFVRQFEDRPRSLALALGCNLLLGLNLSWANYELGRVHADLAPPPGASFLVNGEFGFRMRMMRLGGRMLEASSVPLPGEWIVSSELALGGRYGSLAEALAVPLETRDLASRTPLRLLDRFAHSGFYNTAFGLLPFSFSQRPLDRITYARTSPFWNLNVPWIPTQISGRLVYLPDAGAEIHLPLSRDDANSSRLRFALFARGSGPVTFRIRDLQGGVLFERTVQVGVGTPGADEDIWQTETLPLGGRRDVLLWVDAAPNVRAGWGELVEF